MISFHDANIISFDENLRKIVREYSLAYLNFVPDPLGREGFKKYSSINQS